jgi:hypothetical protein
MYSESDIENAVATGAITPAAAAALRRSVAESRETPAVDEESFRLLTGFNDIFVSIAAILLLVAVGWIGGNIGFHVGTVFGGASTGPGNVTEYEMATGGLLGGVLVAAAAWGLAEYFTRRRRMALPSILLLLAFVGACGAVIFVVPAMFLASKGSMTGMSISLSLMGLGMAAAAYGHWRRFYVPITIAALTGGLALTVIGLILTPIATRGTCVIETWEAREACSALVLNVGMWLSLAAGVVIFAFAMWWDMSDRARITRRSDVAFWLHLSAAPMIAHSVFFLLGVMHGEPGPGKAAIVIVLYLLFGLLALAVDRRALLVSSLAYVLYALSGLFQQFGAISLGMALTALVIGSALLMLSAFWHSARRLIVTRLPDGLRMRLPELDRPAAIPRPA